MLSVIRKRLTYTNVALTLALVFAMSGGAYAASRYVITSTKQIKPGVLAQLKGKAGSAGSQGPTGPAGPQGATGATGATGPKGETGAQGKEGPPGKTGENGKNGTTGFTCPSLDAGLPTQGNLGTDESRSDALLLCSVPTASVFQTGFVDYCCYTPSAEPTGATCLQDQSVPGCAPGFWGFACLGPDIPQQDYPRINCGSAGVRGHNQMGISALLYCCNYEQAD